MPCYAELWRVFQGHAMITEMLIWSKDYGKTAIIFLFYGKPFTAPIVEHPGNYSDARPLNVPKSIPMGTSEKLF